MRIKILLIVIAMEIAVGICWVVHSCREGIHDAYAVWWVADMVIEHMEAHDGAWPSGWDDLKDDYETCVKRSGNYWTFEELRKRVSVDWSANPCELIHAKDPGDRPPFRVIWLRDGGDGYWQGHEPNGTILRYLQERRDRPNNSQAATSEGSAPPASSGAPQGAAP